MLAPRSYIPQGLLGPRTTPVVFNEQSLSRLADVNPQLRALMLATEAEAARRGVDLEVSEGMRTAERQAQLVAQGASQTMNSRHLTGNAVDLHIVGPDGAANWDFEAYRPIADIAKATAANMGINDFVWGGDWQSLRDGVHFQIGGPSQAAPTQMASNGDRLSSSGGSDTMTGGAGGDRMAGLLAPQEPARRPSIWDRLEGVPILGGLADPDRRARLAVGLGGMSLNPNATLMATNLQGIQDRQQERETTQRLNQTIAYLESIGRGDLAALAAIDAGAALQQSARQPETVQPIEINGQLVDPITGAVIGDYRTPEAVTPGYTVLTPDEVTALNLNPSLVWQRGPTGDIQQVEGSGVGTSYIATGDAAASLGLDPQFSYNVESGPEGMRATRIGGEGATTTVNVGPGENAFSAETGKLLAAEANSVVQQGAAAQRALGQIQQLEQALASAPQGAAGGLQRIGAAFGVEMEGVDDITLANSIISKLVPTQREPGSGTMSDADLELFRQSLPRLSNTPGGNQKIVATMRAIAEYDLARGQIARRLQLQEIDMQTAAAEYAALGNPLAEFSQGGASPTVRRYNPATRALE
jgi:hypothetical protein